MRQVIFNIDFDGTCVTMDFPRIGKDIGAQRVLRRIVENGHKLILFTMRSDRFRLNEPETPGIQDVKGPFLTQAVQWFMENNIPLYGVNTNPTQKNWTTSPKSYAQIMIDDSALGCPLISDPAFHPHPFVNWDEVERLLVIDGLLENYTGADVIGITSQDKHLFCKAESFNKRVKWKCTKEELDKLHQLPLIDHNTLHDINNQFKYNWYMLGDAKYGRFMYCPLTHSLRSVTMGEFYETSIVD